MSLNPDLLSTLTGHALHSIGSHCRIHGIRACCVWVSVRVAQGQAHSLAGEYADQDGFAPHVSQLLGVLLLPYCLVSSEDRGNHACLEVHYSYSVWSGHKSLTPVLEPSEAHGADSTCCMRSLSLLLDKHEALQAPATPPLS